MNGDRSKRTPIPACILAAAGAALLGLATPVSANTVYKWTDENGVPNYSDNPPQNREYEKIEMGTNGARQPQQSQSDQEQDAEEEEEAAGAAAAINISEAEIQVEQLEQKVERAKEVYEKARQNRVKGEQIRLGSEQNYVRYLERIENLKEQEQAAKERLENLRGQLEEARSRLEDLREQKRKAQEQGGAGGEDQG